jgi:hypothetical protein
MGRDRVTVTPPITKSQFKLGLDCILKLRHSRPWPAGNRRDRYPTISDENDMLKLLAEGGGAVEALWQAREKGKHGPTFKEERDRIAAAQKSMDLVKAAVASVKAGTPRESLYELTIIHDGFLARIDLLRVCADRLEILEMKAKSVVSSDMADRDNEILDKGLTRVLADWIPYVQDLAFQRVLLEDWLAANHKAIGFDRAVDVVPGLILVNKAAQATANDVLGKFTTIYHKTERGWSPEVTYKGGEGSQSGLLVEMQGVPAAVSMIEADAKGSGDLEGLGIRECMTRMRNMVLLDEWPDPKDRIGAHCKKCEYRTGGGGPSGFGECWGADAATTRHHVLTLYWVEDRHVKAAIAAAEGRQPLVCDVPYDSLESQDPKNHGKPRAQMRQRQHLSVCGSGQAKVAQVQSISTPDLRRGGDRDPCYFIDFECGMYPIPQRVGGRPYELVPFQFEGHRLPNFNAPLDQRVSLDGFLDLTSDDPSVGFVRALKEQLGDHGVVYHWHNYEVTVLRKVRQRLQDPSYLAIAPDRDDLIAYIDRLVGPGEDGRGRFCDLLDVAKKSFYHPDQEGSYSIKRVLPIVWKTEEIRLHFREGHSAKDAAAYGAEHGHGNDDPYDSLPGLPPEFYERLGGADMVKLLQQRIHEDSEEVPEAIRNGGMAMLYYHYVRLNGGGDLLSIQKSFRDYCRLDSAAMVMVFRYMTDCVK